MKKLFLFLSVALFNCAWTFAQDNLKEHFSNNNIAEVTSKFQSNKPLQSLSNLQPSDLKKAGFSLEKTETFDEGVAEIYVKEVNDDEIHLASVKMNNGDFWVKDLDRNVIRWIYNVKLTEDNCTTISTRVSDKTITQLHYSNGIVKEEELIPIVDKYGGNKVLKNCRIFLPDHPEIGYYLFVKNMSHDQSIYPIEFPNGNYLSLPEVFFNGLGDAKIIKNKGANTRLVSGQDYVDQYPGCLIGDRWHYFINGELIPAGLQFLRKENSNEGALFFAAPSDELTDVKHYFDGGGHGYTDSIVFRYINGDRYKGVKVWTGSQENYYEVGTMHKFGGVLTIKKSTGRTLTMPDGTTITINSLRAHAPKYSSERDSIYKNEKIVLGRSDPNSSATESFFIYPAFQSDSLFLYNGTITHPDGTVEKIVAGMTPEEQKKAAEAQEAEKKQKEAEEAKKQAEEEAVTKEQYDQLCKEFGKKYVDAAIEGSLYQKAPIVGMPEKLFVAAYKAERFRQTGNTATYRVYGWGVTNNRAAMTLGNKILKYTVVCVNGKVSRITTHNQ